MLMRAWRRWERLLSTQGGNNLSERVPHYLRRSSRHLAPYILRFLHSHVYVYAANGSGPIRHVDDQEIAQSGKSCLLLLMMTMMKAEGMATSMFTPSTPIFALQRPAT